MTKVEVIVAHSLVQILLAIAQQFIILLVFYVIYKHTMVGSYLMIILLLILLQIMGLFYGEASLSPRLENRIPSSSLVDNSYTGCYIITLLYFSMWFSVAE